MAGIVLFALTLLPAATNAQTHRDGLGATIQELDAALAAARVPEAERLLAELRQLRAIADLSVAELVDLAMATQRVHGLRRAAPLFRAAVERWRKRPQGRTRDPHAWERVAAAHAALGRRRAGRDLLDACWREHPGPATCDAGPLAAMLEARGDWESASTLLDRELGGPTPSSPERWLARVELASRHDEPKAELATALAATGAWPADRGLQEALARALFRNGRHRKAIALLEGLFRQGHERDRLLAMLDDFHGDMSRTRRARPWIQPAWRALDGELRVRVANQDDLVARFLVGAERLRSGQFDQALAAMMAVQKKLPEAARPLVYMALAHHWSGHAERARIAIDRAIALDPVDPAAYQSRALLAGHADKDTAIASLKRYIALASRPGRVQLAGQLGRARADLKLLDKGKPPVARLRPGDRPDRPTPDSLNDPFRVPPLAPLLAGLLALLGGAGLGWWWRRRVSAGT